MAQDHDTESFIDHARHRQEWTEQRTRLQQPGNPASFTVRAVVEVLHDYLKEARVRTHRFRSDEGRPGGNDEAPNPLGYFVAAVGFWLLTQLVRFASVEGVPLTAASMDLRAEFPNELKFDLDPSASSAMEELRYVVAVESSAPLHDVLRVVRRAEENCHAVQSLRNPVPIFPVFRLNGEEVPLEGGDH